MKEKFCFRIFFVLGVDVVVKKKVPVMKTKALFNFFKDIFRKSSLPNKKKKNQHSYKIRHTLLK